jgi:UDP-glucose 4-epimerase
MSSARLRTVVTGAGLVGCHAARELTGAGHQVLLLDVRPEPGYLSVVAGPQAELARRDITDVDRLTEDLRAWRAEAIVHTAALVGPKADAHPFLAYWVNTGGTTAVAEAARRAGVTRLVHVSTLAVYDWDAVLASGAVSVPETAPTSARTVYGGSKLAAEAVVTSYAGGGWFRAAILRLAGVFGPGFYLGGSQVGRTLQRAVAQARRGQEVVIGPALAGHEYLYAADAGRAARLAFHALDQARDDACVYNIGTGRLYMAADVAAAIQAAVPGSKVTPGPGPRPPFRPVDVTRAHRELGFEPVWDLERGIAALASFQDKHGSDSHGAPTGLVSVDGGGR